jgi:hypothetical protein
VHIQAKVSSEDTPLPCHQTHYTRLEHEELAQEFGASVVLAQFRHQQHRESALRVFDRADELGDFLFLTDRLVAELDLFIDRTDGNLPRKAA